MSSQRRKLIALDIVGSLVLAWGLSYPIVVFGGTAYLHAAGGPRWVYSGPYPFSHMGGGPGLASFLCFTPLISIVLTAVGLWLKEPVWKWLPRGDC